MVWWMCLFFWGVTEDDDDDDEDKYDAWEEEDARGRKEMGVDEEEEWEKTRMSVSECNTQMSPWLR